MKAKIQTIEFKRLVLKIALGVALVGIVVCTVGIIDTAKQYSNSKKEYSRLNMYVSVNPDRVTKQPTVETEPEEIDEQEVPEEAVVKLIDVDFDMDFDALQKINPDLVGWLYYEPLEISYPIVLGRDDDYYEHYSFEQEKNVAGAIFTDYLCKPDLTNFNTIIYGHSMRNGTMFGKLKNFMLDESLYLDNPNFYVFTKDEALMYEIVAIYYTGEKSQTYDLKVDYTQEEKQEYIDYMEESATFKNEEFFKNGIDENTKICTLSTCHGHNTGKRTVVQAVLKARESR